MLINKQASKQSAQEVIVARAVRLSVPTSLKPMVWVARPRSSRTTWSQRSGRLRGMVGFSKQSGIVATPGLDVSSVPAEE
jgi:hypothetical protein